MHIGILSSPNNFHTRKWARALIGQGAAVTVFSFEASKFDEFPTVRLDAPFAGKGTFNYFSYQRGGKVLRQALEAHQVDVLNALNVTPFGVWAGRSGFRPLIQSALGADILEYPPTIAQSPFLKYRSWDNPAGKKNRVFRTVQGLKRKFHRGQVHQALKAGDLITGDNQYLIDCIHDWFGIEEGQLRLLRWGVEPELFPGKMDAASEEAVRYFGLPEGKKVVLSPRGVKAIYQGDLILDAFAKVLATGRADTYFLMLSAGYTVPEAFRAKAMLLMEQYPLFRFLDHEVPRELMYQLWPGVDVMVSAPVYDGYSAALAEGRFAGVIPVVNGIPANRELIRHGENGWIADPFTPEKLTTDLQYILDHCGNLRARFSESNRSWINQYSLVSENAGQFIGWCEALLAGSSGNS